MLQLCSLIFQLSADVLQSLCRLYKSFISADWPSVEDLVYKMLTDMFALKWVAYWSSPTRIPLVF